MKKWIPAAEISHLWSESQWKIWAYGHRKWESLHSGVSRFVCKVRIRLFSGVAQATVQLKWSQTRERSFLLLLGLPINPSYLQLARKSCSLNTGPGSRDAPSEAYHNPFSKHSRENFFPPLWSSCLLRVLFFPCSLLSPLFLPGYLRD